jgi:hypothetical protein
MIGTEHPPDTTTWGAAARMRRRRRYRFYLAWLAIIGANRIIVVVAIVYGLTALAVHFWAPT